MTATTTKGRTRTYVQALTEALDIAMGKDASVFLLGEDIGKMGGDFGVTRGLFDKYGAERVRDTPLSEAAIVGACVGAAMVGMRPVAEIMFADFLGECYDQLVNNAAKMHYMFDGQFKASIVVRTACGGGFGGGPHHSQSVEAGFSTYRAWSSLPRPPRQTPRVCSSAPLKMITRCYSSNTRRSIASRAMCQRATTPRLSARPPLPARART